MKKSKKIIIIFLFVVLIFGAVIFFVNFYSKKKNKEEKMQPEESMEYIQSIYGMVRWQELMDKYKINYDKNVVEDMKKKYISIIEKTDIDNMSMLELTKVVYINSKWELEEYYKYNSYLGDYYDDENKIFFNYKINDMKSKDDLYEQGVQISYAVYDILNNLDIDLSNFEIYDGLKEYYNRSDNSEINSQIIYLFVKNDKLELIDYLKEKEYFNNLYNNWVNDVNSENYKISVEDFDINNFVNICKKMNIDSSILEKKYSEYKIDYNDSKLLFPFDDTSLNYSNDVMSVYWDVLYYEYGFVEMDEILGNDLATNFKNYYDNCLKTLLKKIDN